MSDRHVYHTHIKTHKTAFKLTTTPVPAVFMPGLYVTLCQPRSNILTPEGFVAEVWRIVVTAGKKTARGL